MGAGLWVMKIKIGISEAAIAIEHHRIFLPQTPKPWMAKGTRANASAKHIPQDVGCIKAYSAGESIVVPAIIKNNLR
jgi:hypothetical protein